jgi:hypothetical protein
MKSSLMRWWSGSVAARGFTSWILEQRLSFLGGTICSNTSSSISSWSKAAAVTFRRAYPEKTLHKRAGGHNESGHWPRRTLRVTGTEEPKRSLKGGQMKHRGKAITFVMALSTAAMVPPASGQTQPATPGAPPAAMQPHEQMQPHQQMQTQQKKQTQKQRTSHSRARGAAAGAAIGAATGHAARGAVIGAGHSRRQQRRANRGAVTPKERGGQR